MSWEDLEEKVKNWLEVDDAMIVPGSGNGRGEEDVIGVSTIAQCKYTENKNASILAKDMRRLKDAGKMMGKFPLFVNESSEGVVVSIPECDVMKDILEYIVVINQLEYVYNELLECKNPDVIEQIYNLFEKIQKKASGIISKVNKKICKIKIKFDIKYQALTTYDMFEEAKNERTIRPEGSETKDSCVE